MAWLEIHQSLPTHRKTLAVADELNANPAHITGHLVCLWLWALDNAQDGVLNVSPRMIARAAQWDGEPEAFVAALTHAGLLDGDGRIHDWNVYAGRLIETRRRNVARAQAWREQQRAHNVPSIDSAANAHVTHNEPVTYGATQQYSTEPVRESGAPDADAPDAATKRHPAITAYRNLTGKRSIKVGAAKRIEAAVAADDPAAVTRWRDTVDEWVNRGYRPENVAGMLDWFRDGIPPRPQHGGLTTLRAVPAGPKDAAPKWTPPDESRRAGPPPDLRVPSVPVGGAA